MGRSSQRRVFSWAAFALVLGTVLCFVPLFDLLGYELSLALCALAAVASIHLGIRAVNDLRTTASPATLEAAEVRRLQTLTTVWLATWLRACVVLLVPLGVSLLNALRVKNCNIGLGVAWYVVHPVVSALVGAAYGVALGVVWPRVTRVALLAAVLVPLIGLLWSLAHFYTSPPIFAFDPLLGYWAGTIYDERVTVPTALIAARAYHVALALAAIALAAAFLDGATMSTRWRSHRTRLFTVIAVGVAVIGYRAGPREGYFHDAQSIQRALAGTKATTHFVLHFEVDGPVAHELDDYARELEFRWDELAHTLGHAPNVAVHVYAFSSPAMKQSLMGAGTTYIAKPWRREIYVNHEPFPSLVLGHELAHVFGADDGDALLGVARRGLRLDMGLTEGWAEALTWQDEPLTADESARVLDELHRLPPLDAVMSPEFWSLPQQQAYPVAGSFCHFLLERFGVAKFAQLFHAGGVPDSYASIYGASFAELGTQWLAYVHKVELAPGVLERERDRLLRPSIFRRPCARELARKLELARAASWRGDHATAQQLLEAVCADEPDDPGHLQELLITTARAGDSVAAHAIAERVFAHRKTSLSQRAATWSALGDLAVKQEAWSEAAQDYTRAEAQPSEEAQGRLYTVKRILSTRLAGELSPALRAALVPLEATLVKSSGDAALDFLHLTEPARVAPEDPLLGYLAARQLAGKAMWADAKAGLAASAGDLPDERFTREAHRLYAEVLFREHDYAQAAARFTELTKSGPAAARIDAARWVRRCQFFARNP